MVLLMLLLFDVSCAPMIIDNYDGAGLHVAWTLTNVTCPHDTVGVGDCPYLTTVPIGAVGPGMETGCLVGWFDR